MTSTPYNYTMYYQHCSTDSFLNTCYQGCCYGYQGGLTEKWNLCFPSIKFQNNTIYNLCEQLISPNQTLSSYNYTSIADHCVTDYFGNTCHDQCCLHSQIAPTGTSCVQKSYCQGYDTGNLYTPANIQKYAQSAGVILPINSLIDPSESSILSSPYFGLGLMITLAIISVLLIGITVSIIYKYVALNSRVDSIDKNQRSLQQFNKTARVEQIQQVE